MKAGVLNVDKPVGVSSFAVVRRLRELTGARRVGHAGTLDPLASGVLPILFESATRLSDLAHQLPKTYDAAVHLGFRSATDDAEAELELGGSTAGLNREHIAQALRQFVGAIQQEPPAFSAVKVEGRRAYRRAREGKPERPPARQVQIHSAELLDFRPGPPAVAVIRVVCASGVYLRSLARDLGEKLGCGGYLGELVRSAYGPLKVADAVQPEQLLDRAALEARLLPSEVLLPEMPPVRLTVEQEAQVRQGRAVRVLPEPGPGLLSAHDESGRLVALGHTDLLRRTFVPDKVLA
ncbi:MAG: tRNA pseudouridine(55) synthase TruB [Candidatus Dormibacter sp.]|uniref:tRNA pseudouridine(55) synthase TruB n=1 Tax=Candidatus Dormibacter sp. TaxID=2973982 RepID=UPI0026943C41